MPFKAIPLRVQMIGTRIKYDTSQPNESGWAARERMHGNRHARGYGTAWDKLRKVIMARDKGLCQSCLRTGRPEKASQVDHIVPKSQGGTDEPSNCEAICLPCHKVKTARESHGAL